MTTPIHRTRWLKLGAFSPFDVIVNLSLSGVLGLGTIRGYLIGADKVRRVFLNGGEARGRNVKLIVLLSLTGAALGSALLLSTFAHNVQGNFIAFGPVDFVRGPGKPDRETRTFSVLNQNTSYTLQISNGGQSGQFRRAAKARVMLNGTRIVSHRDFRHRVAFIEKRITLARNNTLVVEVRGPRADDDDRDDVDDDDRDDDRPPSGFTLRIIGSDNDLPTIGARIEPAPAANGWNHTNATVSFDCSDRTSGIANCSAPIVVSTEGAHQPVTGTATDRAGNTATTAVRLNIDKTPPSLSITAPADGSTTSATAVMIAGNAAETVSGLASITCNGAAANLTGASFSCDVSLNVGPNHLAIIATDAANNSATTSLTINRGSNTSTVPDVSGATHASAQQTITAANLVVGSIETANSGTVPAGHVINQTPASGATVPAGSAVSIVLSLGAVDAAPPLSFAVDPSVTPLQASIPSLPDGAPRLIASVADDDNERGSDFVQNEVLILTNEANQLNAFLARWHGQVLTTADPAQARLSGIPRIYLVRIDPNLANPASLVADLRAQTRIGTGTYRISSDSGLNLLAAAAMENAGGLRVVVNWVMHNHDFADKNLTEDPAGSFMRGGIDHTNNPFNWPYMNRLSSGGGFQDIGVADAWRALASTGKLNNHVRVMIIDSGFDTSGDADFPPNRLTFGQIDEAGPGVCGDLSGSPCEWHGTPVVEAGMALPGNNIGVAGPGGPVSDMILTGMRSFDLGVFVTTIVDTLQSLSKSPDILDISAGLRIPAVLGVEADELVGDITGSLRIAGTLVFASAGNEGRDVDGTQCVIACWEKNVYVPCESDGVICVGGQNWDSVNRHPASNYGSDPGDCCTVDIYGPYELFLNSFAQSDPNTGRPFRGVHLDQGTSYTSPFVAGVAALVWAANPDLSDDEVEDILMRTAHTNDRANVPRWVNAYGAVLEALPNDPPTIRIEAQPTVPCPGATPNHHPADPIEVCVSRGTDIRFTASAFDNEDAHNVTVAWSSDVDGPLGSGTLITRNDLRFGTHHVTGMVTDTNGFQTTDTLIVRVLNDQPPTVTINSPRDRAAFQQGQEIPLSGTSFDTNNPPAYALPDIDTEWHLDGATLRIATGHTGTISGSGLRSGVHTLRFFGFDRATAPAVFAVDLMSFTVLPNGPLPGQAPNVTISSPHDGATLVANDTGDGRFGVDVTLSANATDAEDSSIPDSRFVWTISVNGGPEETLEVGQSIMQRLFTSGPAQVTSNTITVYVTDNDGNVSSSSVHIQLTGPDADGDGLTFEQELAFGTNPNNHDTDGDGVWDGAEIVFGLNPNSATSTLAAIPGGTLLGQGGRDLLVLNPTTGFFGVQGRPTLLGFGMAFDRSGRLFIADNDRLRTFAPLTETNTVVGTFGAPDGDAIEIAQMAFNPVEGRLYGIELSPVPNGAVGQLVRIQPTTGAATRVGTGAGMAIHGIAFRNDETLFATVRQDDTTDRLVILSFTTGAILSDLGPVGFPNVYGLAFDLNGVLVGSQHVSGSESRLLTIDTTSGAATPGPMVGREMFNLAVAPRTVSFVFNVTCCPTLNLDASANTGTIVSYTWDLGWTPVSPDRVTASPTTSFQIREVDRGNIVLTVTYADGTTGVAVRNF